MTRTTALSLALAVGVVVAVGWLVLWTNDEPLPALEPAPGPTESSHDAGAPPEPVAHGTGTSSVETLAAPPAPAHAAEPSTTTTGFEVVGRCLRNGQGFPCTVAATRRERGRRGAQPTDVVVRQRTDAAGRFMFRVPRGDYRLTLEHEDAPREYYRDITVVQDTALGEIRVPPVATLRGRVVDADHVPVPGARIYVAFNPSINTETPPRDPSITPHAMTDDAGHFEIRRLLAADTAVLVDATGYPDLCVKRRLDERDARVETFVLRRGKQTTGRVVTTEGRPVAGAVVVPCDFNTSKQSKAVRADGSGNFTIAGVGGIDQYLLVSHPDYQTKRVDWNTECIELAPAIALTVQVRGAKSKPYRLRIGLHGDDARGPYSVPSSTWDAMRSAWEIRDADSFVVHGLTRGVYELSAFAEGYGQSDGTRCDLTESCTITLEVKPTRFVAVRVTDEDGAALARTRVVLRQWNAASDKVWSTDIDTFVTDDEGRVPVPPAGYDCAVIAHVPGKVRAEARLRAGAWPARIDLTLRHGGAIVGALGPADAVRRYRCEVHAWRWREDGTIPERPRAFGTPDAQGRFRLDELPSGDYGVGLWWHDDHWRDDPRRRLPDGKPLLGGGLDSRSIKRVTVRAGETTRCALAVAPFGTIEGRVFRGGVPVSEVIVLGQRQTDVALLRVNPADKHAHRSRPYVRTAADGSFSFAYSLPGAFELFALAPGAAFVSKAVRIEATGYGARYACDVHLAAGTIHGRVDQSGWSDRRRALTRVTLLRARDAGKDPFGIDVSLWSEIENPAEKFEIEVDHDGAFAFEGVPPGNWVVRVTSEHRTIEAQRAIRVGERQDLGILRSKPRIPITLRIAPPTAADAQGGFGVWIRQNAPNSPTGLFVDELSVRDGTVIARLAAGRYAAQLFAASERSIEVLGLGGAPIGKPQTFRVAPDGTVEPAVLRFPPSE